jgi:hypothetical protein
LQDHTTHSVKSQFESLSFSRRGILDAPPRITDLEDDTTKGKLLNLCGLPFLSSSLRLVFFTLFQAIGALIDFFSRTADIHLFTDPILINVCLDSTPLGTYGIVYKAQNRETNDVVALKRIRLDNEEEGVCLSTSQQWHLLIALHVDCNKANEGALFITSLMSIGSLYSYP